MVTGRLMSKDNERSIVYRITLQSKIMGRITSDMVMRITEHQVLLVSFF